MKNEKYILWGSVVILLGVTGFFIFSKTPAKVDLPLVATSSPLVNSEGKIDPSLLSTSTNKFNTKDWSAVYQNEKYGFALTFPETWSGYRVTEATSSVWFGVEDQDQVFAISVYSLQEWEDLTKESKKAGAKALPGVVGKDASHIFVVERAQNFSEKVMSLISVYPSILTTFAVKK
jgi:hypothetical protein